MVAIVVVLIVNGAEFLKTTPPLSLASFSLSFLRLFTASNASISDSKMSPSLSPKNANKNLTPT